MIRRVIAGTAMVAGLAFVGAPTTASAQPGYGDNQRSAAPSGQQTGTGRASSGGPSTGAQTYRGGAPSQGAYSRTSYNQGPGNQGSGGQGTYGQGSYGQQSGQGGGYGQGAYGGDAYGSAGQAYCREDDDLESLRCHHRFHSRGWYRDNERAAYARGDHYRGYQEDGTGRRFYDRGGYGVGHDDYTRDYDPLRGY